MTCIPIISLIDEVFGKDTGDVVPMEKVVMLLWQFRDDPQVVTFMTRFVAQFSGSRHVFDGIEFYLPQMAHMIIHLEAEWDDKILERFALMIAQQSLHFALQLNWILQGAIEDYQPELPDGSMNPNYSPLFYSRCIKLLTNIERSVVYRKRSSEFQRMYEKGIITKKELQKLEQGDRLFDAELIIGDNNSGEIFGGNLLYKRKVRRSCFKAKPWKNRYFSIEERMLNCYSKKGGRLIRSMPLEGAVVEIVESHRKKYRNMFSVCNRTFEFVMRATSEDVMDRWMKLLKDEANSSPVFGHMDDNINTESEDRSRVLSEMTPVQRSRFDFFKDERDFIRNITDIAEELRFKEPAERKVLAPKMLKDLNVPSCVYSPLCNSTDIWRRVTGTLYNDTKVFNTNERCPVIMHFLAERDGNTPDLGVAEFFHRKLIRGDETASSIQEVPEDEIDEEEEKKLTDFWQDTVMLDDQPITETPKAGNKNFNRFIREGFHSIPSKLATKIKKKKMRRPSELSNATGMQSVKIVEQASTDYSQAGTDFEDIDEESINRAKQVVSGGESWIEKTGRMLEEAKDKSSDKINEVVSVMSKSNDDLRQEVFIMQMIHYYKSVFTQANLPLWLKTYRILSTSSSTGLIEVLVDATSLDGLKKSENYPKEGGLRKYFEETYGGPNSTSFKAAQTNFMQSLAAYSLMSYILGVNDRHNGNVMIDNQGHLIHIDFGFVMGMAPGHEFSMERAPFKFTKEYLEVMGGFDDDCFKEFERLFVEGLKVARENSQIALGLVEIMMYKSNYPCFVGARYGRGVSLKRFEKRLFLKVRDENVERRAKALIRKAYDHVGTNLYDSFQQYSNGYAI